MYLQKVEPGKYASDSILTSKTYKKSKQRHDKKKTIKESNQANSK